MRRLAALAVTLVVGLSGPPARAEEDALVTRLFKLQHQRAEGVGRALRHMGSGLKEARLDAQDHLDSIAVRDRPANVAAIEQAVKHLDVPHPDVVFHMRLLIAGPHSASDIPADMQKVVRQLEQNLRFKSYHQVSAITQRVRSGAKLESHGMLQINAPALEKNTRTRYELELRPVVTGTRKGARTIQLRSLSFELESREIGEADIRTDIVIPEGEIVVVGTAAVGDRAMVLVVWASAT